MTTTITQGRSRLWGPRWFVTAEGRRLASCGSEAEAFATAKIAAAVGAAAYEAGPTVEVIGFFRGQCSIEEAIESLLPVQAAAAAEAAAGSAAIRALFAGLNAGLATVTGSLDFADHAQARAWKAFDEARWALHQAHEARWEVREAASGREWPETALQF